MSDQELRDKLANEYAPEYNAMNEAFVKTAFRAGWDAARANPTAAEATEEVLKTHEVTLLKLRISELEDTAAQLGAAAEKLAEALDDFIQVVCANEGIEEKIDFEIGDTSVIGDATKALAEYRAQYPKESK